jgi:hypothetical protein
LIVAPKGVVKGFQHGLELAVEEFVQAGKTATFELEDQVEDDRLTLSNQTLSFNS